jgi:hypothetical protein
MFRRWIEAIGQSVLATVLLALVPGAIVAWLVKIQSAWATPLLWGLAAALMMALIVVIVRANLRLPPKRLIPNTKNIADCLRTWLDNFNYGIKNSPDPAAHFCFLVTTESERKMLVARLKEDTNSEYVFIKAIIGPSPEEIASLNKLTDAQRARLLLVLKLELSRRQIGYRGLVFPPNDFFIFKRIPISTSLTEDEFIKALDEVEAALHGVFNLGALVLLENAPPAAKSEELHPLSMPLQEQP